MTDLYVEDLYAVIDSTKRALPGLTIICATHCFGRPYLIDFDIDTIWIAGHRIPVVPYVEAAFEALHVIREHHGITDEPVHSRRLQLVPEPRNSCEIRLDDIRGRPSYPWAPTARLEPVEIRAVESVR